MSAIEQFLIEPTFQDIGSAAVLEFTVGDVNLLANAEFNSHVGFYQRQFGMYSYMRMNQMGDYVMHYPKGNALLIQPHNSCAWTPQGHFFYAKKTIAPYKMKINVEECYDEYMDSTFDRFLEWGGSPEVAFSQAGVQASNNMTRLIMENSTLGVRAVLTGGGLFTGTQLFMPAVPTEIRDAFTQTASTGQGWIQGLRVLKAQDADKYGHLDNPLIVAGDVSNDGEQFTGDPLALYDARVAAAPRKLRRAIKRGGRGGFGGSNMPIWMVSASVADQMYDAKLAQDVTTAQNKPRITVETYSVPTGRGGNTNMMVYVIDEMTRVIPLEELEVFSEYLTGTVHCDYLTLTGVIQLGGSFGSIPERGSANIAMRIQRSIRNEDLGKTTYLSHMLGANGINDTDYIAGGYGFFEPQA